MFIIKVFLSLFIVFSSHTAASDKLEYLGSPYLQKYPHGESAYARNVWDMQLFANKIYIGAGNSSNRGPVPNAGRVPLIAYSITDSRFTKEYTVAEEQIDKFAVFNSTLFIPGHDATQKWTFGNIYSKTQNSQWQKFRTLPKALHVYDLVVLNNKIFAAVGLKGRGGVYVSSDSGETWDSYSLGSGRVYSFFMNNNTLFATRTFRLSKKDKVSIFEWIEESSYFKPRPDLNLKALFPSTKLSGKSYKIYNSVSHNGNTVYLGGYKHNDHQTKPVGAYSISSLAPLTVRRIKLSDNYTPRDLKIQGSTFFILASKFQNSQYTNKVFKSTDTKIWSPVLSFKYPSFARSFEKTKSDCFYFGIGSDLKSSKNWKIESIKNETGDILRYCL